MRCSFLGLNVVDSLGEGGFAYVFLVKEVLTDSSDAAAASSSGLAKKVKDKAHLFDDGTYAMKKVFGVPMWHEFWQNVFRVFKQKVKNCSTDYWNLHTSELKIGSFLIWRFPKYRRHADWNYSKIRSS
ncbi:unnamed protein product [Rhodiola kirilowii]